MARYFNGAYSVRAGYHGVRRERPAPFWGCQSCGHINPDKRTIDERPTGGFCHSEPVKACEKCGEARGAAKR